MAAVSKCKTCGEDINPLMKFCGKCGTPVEYVEEVPTAVPIEPFEAAAPVAATAAAAAVPTVAAPAVAVPAVEPTPTPIGAKCNNCGGAIDASMKFCSICGAPVGYFFGRAEGVAEGAMVSPAKPTQKAVGKNVKAKFFAGNRKKFILPLVAVAVIIAIGAWWGLSSKRLKYEQSDFNYYIFSGEDGITILSKDGKSMAIDGDEISAQEYSLDQARVAILVDRSMEAGEVEGVLYLVTDELIEIADDVYGMRISLSGEGIAFVNNVDLDARVGDLCLYHDGRITTVTADFNIDSGYTLSPDGKVVGYTLVEDEEAIGYLYDGKQHELGKDIIPVAVADGGKYLYYNKGDNLYVQKGMDTGTRVNLGSNARLEFVNMDLSQVICQKSDESYLAINGEKNSKLPDVSNILTPRGTARIMGGMGSVIGVDSFVGTYYHSVSGDVYYISDKSGETRRVVRNVSNAAEVALADNGKTITYLKNDTVSQIDGSKENADSMELVEEVDYFMALDDGKAIYYRNEDDELFFQKGNNKPVAVSDDESYSWSLYKGKTLFYLSDWEVYRSDGNKGSLVKGLDDGAIYISCYDSMIIVYIGDGYMDVGAYVYFSTDGETFREIE